MIFRNSILSIIRSGGKTALFTLLIFALTLVLALGVSVWASVAQFLDDCDEFYTTIGLIEYMGTGYPDDTGYDAGMAAALESFNTGAIQNDDATLLWDTPRRSFGYVDGFWRTDNFVPGQMLSVLVVGNASYSEERDLYSAIVMNSLYSFKSETDTIILIDEDFGTFEPGRYYLVFGEVYRGQSPLLHLRSADFNHPVAAAKGIAFSHMVDITSDGSDGRLYTIPDDSVMLEVAETLRVRNNSVLVWGTDDLMALLPFHQQELYFVDGRAFTEEEYARGSRVAVISELMASRLGIGVGDSIDLSVAVSDYPGIYNSYWATEGFDYSEKFTVVGITNTVMDKSWYVFVPGSAGVPSSLHPVGYTVGQVVVRNADAAAFAERMQSVVGGRFQLTIYDQGYSTVAIPYQTILRVAMIVTAVCALVELAVVILFGFLFVYRQREASETMRMLGATGFQVCRYFLYSSGFISLIATTAGAAAGYWLHGYVIDLVVKAAENVRLIDTRFSNGNLTITRVLEFAPDLEWPLFMTVGGIVFVLAVLSCLAFTLGTFIRSRPSQRTPQGPRGQHKTSHLTGGSIKYALLSIWRGGTRSLVVPVLAVVVVVFFGQLATTAMRYQEQLDAIYDNTAIGGYYTDIRGKQIGNQVLDAYDVAQLYHTGLIEDLSVSISEPYLFLGISRLADGTEFEIEPLYEPANSFVRESLEESILRGPDLTATNDIRTAPEFYYAEHILMNFADGYDESFLANPSNSDPFSSDCILPTSLMAEHGINLGDTIRVTINRVYTDPADDARKYLHFDLHVVGSYEKQGVQDTIYTPLSLLFYPSVLWDDLDATTELPGVDEPVTPEVKKAYLQQKTLHSASFTLSNSRDLITLKDYLTDYGYSQVNQVSRVREFIVLKDAAFNNAVASVRQQIRYINTLYPCLYALVGIIAFVVSYLLIVSRKREFATMRGLGATHTGSFFSFFFEQSLLCLQGTAVGFAVWHLAGGADSALHMSLVVGFLVCYFLGCAVSIMIMNQSNVLTILLDKD